MKVYKLQIVKHCIIERSIGAESPEEAEEIAREKYKCFNYDSAAVQITTDVISERELYPCEMG